MDDELKFVIDARFKPTTIPMARLAEYMAGLAALLGYQESVHFVRLDEGSVELVHTIEEHDAPKLDDRLARMRMGEGDADAIKAFRRLDEMLANDNAIGRLSRVGATVIEFPGCTRPKPTEYGAFNQQGSLDGVPIKIGGKGDVVPVHLQECGTTGVVRTCQASRGTAREIAENLFERPVRVHGTGRWKRETSGQWSLQKFMIQDFEVLDDATLRDAIKRLREVQGSKWREVEHPLAELTRLRWDGEDMH